MINHDIDIEVRDITPTSSLDDHDRKELLWEKREETVLYKWCEDCRNLGVKHDVAGKRNKLKFGMTAFPAIIIPIILGGVSQIVPCHSLPYSLGIMLSALFSGMNAFFNFGRLHQLHLEFSNRFSELSNDITCELSKPKAHRIACDVYYERIKQQYNSLSAQSPTI
jgi:hypothetical protein